MDNSAKIILDLCGGTGAWSNPYADAGYNVQIINLPDYDVTRCKIRAEYEDMVFEGLNGKLDLLMPLDVYGILAAPKCTEFSYLRNALPRKGDFREGMVLVDACLSIIKEAGFTKKLKFWAIENPKGYLRRLLGKPYMEWNPCDYGDPWTKKTDLWGFFNKPKQNKVEPVDTRFARSNPTLELPAGYIKPPDMLDNRACRRSITPPGFAQAFFKANK